MAFFSPQDSAVISCLILLFCRTGLADGLELRRLFPLGAQRSQTVQITLAGKFPTWPVQVWQNETGITWEPQPESGKLKAIIAADAVPGPRIIRCFDATGVTAARRFIVGTQPELTEVEPNNERSKAQPIANLPVVINAVLEGGGDVDNYQIALHAGETLIASIDAARRLKSPLDACLQIVDSRGFVIQQNLDARGLDPLLVYTAVQDQSVLVRVFGFPAQPDTNIAFVGGEAYVYRLTLTTSGLLESARPLAIDPLRQTPLRPVGLHLPADLTTLEIATISDPELCRAFHPSLQGTIDVPLFAGAIVVEQDRTLDKSPQSLPIPATLTGTISDPHEKDTYEIMAVKGQTYQITVESRRFNYPLDAVITLLDSMGKQLQRTDDADGSRDPRLTWQAPADGSYQVVVSDLNEEAGGDYIYRLTVAPSVPDYKLHCKTEVISGKFDEALQIAIAVDRQSGFKEPIHVSLTGLPEGFTCDPVTSQESGDTSKEVKLTIKSPKHWIGPCRIIGQIPDQPAYRHLAKVGDDSGLDVWIVIR